MKTQDESEACKIMHMKWFWNKERSTHKERWKQVMFCGMAPWQPLMKDGDRMRDSVISPSFSSTNIGFSMQGWITTGQLSGPM
jgi:hypothetical protein